MKAEATNGLEDAHNACADDGGELVAAVVLQNDGSDAGEESSTDGGEHLGQEDVPHELAASSSSAAPPPDPQLNSAWQRVFNKSK